MAKKKSSKNKKPNVNYRVVIYSLIALTCLFLTFTVDWFFIIPAAVLAWLNQRELMGKK